MLDKEDFYMSDSNHPPFTVMPFEPIDNGVYFAMRLLPNGVIQIADKDTLALMAWQTKWNMSLTVKLENLAAESPKPATCPSPSPTSTTSSAPG